MPVASAIPASASWSSATASPMATTVGLSIRLYAYPGCSPVRTAASSSASPEANVAVW